MFAGASGSRPSPLKIAGSEINRIEELSVAARMPTVVTESATRRSWTSLFRTDTYLSLDILTIFCRSRGAGIGRPRHSVDSGAVTVQPIRLFGDPVLRTPADPVVDFDKELRTLVADLAQTMLDAPGQGLAAPQI